jgi:hypothetical protein
MTDMKWLRTLTLLAFACLIGCGTQPSVTGFLGVVPTQYASTSGVTGEKLVLQCGSLVNTAVSCQLWQEGGRNSISTKTSMEFIPLTESQQYLKDLVESSAKDAVEFPRSQRDFPLTDKDIPLFRSMVRGHTACFADKKYADLILVCSTNSQSSETVVMFIRGLCNSCPFQPAVLRKIN